jgi:hypothetical protein
MQYNTGIMDAVQYRYYGCSTTPVLHNTGIVLHP